MLVLHLRPLQVLAQLAAIGRGGQATPLLPPAMIRQHQRRVPNIGTPPPDVSFTWNYFFLLTVG